MSWRNPEDPNGQSRRSCDTVELPLILTAALAELRHPIPHFLASLVCGWQFRRLRQEPYRLEVEAIMSLGGLTSFIWLGPQVRYYYPANAIVVFGATLPAKQMQVSGVPLAAILWHPLLADERIVIRKVETFHRQKSHGVRFLLDTPKVSYDLYQRRSE